MLDEIDKRLLEELQENSNQTTYQISKKLNIPRTTVHHRIKKLESEGYIKKYKAIVDAKKLNKGLTVMMGVTVGMDANSRNVSLELMKIPQVEEVYIISGQFDLLIKLRLENTDELAKIIFNLEHDVRNTHGISKTESMIVLSTEKEYGSINL